MNINNNSPSANAWFVACILLFVGFLILGANSIGNQTTLNRIKQEAIQYNYAEYNPTNGNWQWKPK